MASKQFDMNRTWSQAVALVQGNFQLLAVIAGVFMLLPTLLFYFMVPDVLAFSAAEGDPDLVAQRLEGMLPSLMIYGIAAFVLQLVGYSAMIALVGADRPTVSEAIGRGFRALPSAIGAMLLGMVCYMLFAVLFGVLMGIVGAVLALVLGGQNTGGVVALAGLLYAVMFVATLYLFGRLSLTLAVIVLERQGNPWRALLRSWRMTAPRAWAILGFFALLFIAYFVIAMVLALVLGALGVAAGGMMGTGSLVTASLLYGLVGMAAAMLLSAIFVSMHGQLAGPARRQVAETLE